MSKAGVNTGGCQLIEIERKLSILDLSAHSLLQYNFDSMGKLLTL